MQTLAIVFREREADLNALDTVIGDGDHGTTMARGFARVVEAASGTGRDAGAVLQAAGRALLAMGGASGPLFGTMLLAAGDAVAGFARLNAASIATMLEASAGRVKARGHVDRGDKTMFDALAAAAESAHAGVKAGVAVAEVLAWAADAARIAAEQTRQLQARQGRARFLGEQTIGHPDPGAISVWLMLDALAKLVRDHPDGPDGPSP
jgi:dihydroxyacetone kinase-like protein